MPTFARMRARRHARAAPYVLSLWVPGDMVVTAESEVEAEQMKAATWGANGLILGHPRHTPQSFNDKTVAIFVPADGALAVSICERERARHKG